MKINKIFVPFLFLLTLTCFNPIHAASLHLILVGDTLARDIKESVMKDAQNADKQALEICYQTGLKLKRYSFKEERANAKNVQKYLQGLSVDADDVVIFYFSGHGYRTPSKESNPWPNLYFTFDQSGLDLMDVASMIKQTKAHLSIVLADCCNNSIPDAYAPNLARRQFLASSPSGVEANYKKLFLESDGHIIAVGAEVGQFSYGNSMYGGLFSHSYFETFNTMVNQMPVDILNWQMLFDKAVYETQLKAISKGLMQDPIYSIH